MICGIVKSLIWSPAIVNNLDWDNMYVFGSNRRVQRAGQQLSEEALASQEFTPIDYRQANLDLDFGNSRFIRPQESIYTDNLLLRQNAGILGLQLDNYIHQLQNTPVTEVAPTPQVPATQKPVEQPKQEAKPKPKESTGSKPNTPTISSKKYILGQAIENERKALAAAEKDLAEAQRTGNQEAIGRLTRAITDRKANIELIKKEL